MKIFVPLLLIAMFTFSGLVFAQSYPLWTIEQIQYQHPDSLLQNGDQELHIGDTLRVRGVVMARPIVDPFSIPADRRNAWNTFTRWMTFIVDPDGQQYEAFDGILVIQHDTVGAAQNTFFDLVDTAQVVEFTGVVDNFFTTSQFALLTDPATEVQFLGNVGQRPAPIELTISDFVDAQGNWDVLSEKYEGMYVIIRNVVSSDRNIIDGTFRINDGQGNSMGMYDQSGYFTLRPHRLIGLTDYDPPIDGSNINFIRGFIQTHSDLGARIAPAFPGDIEIGASSPAISEIRRDASEIMSGQPVGITTSIIDFDGLVQEAKIFYRVDNGLPDSVAMVQDVVDTTKWSGTIPGITSDSSLVDYYIQSIDNDGRVATNPSNINAPEFFYLVLNRNVTIQDVQYNPLGTGISGYRDHQVTLSGVITADITDFPGTGPFGALMVYMQNGIGPWSGIRIGTNGSLGNDVIALNKGDNVTITGTITEPTANSNLEVTRIDTVSDIIINSTGNPLPEFQELETGQIGFNDNGLPDKEQWEGVLIKYNNLLVTDENADGPPSNFGEMLVDDGTGDTRVELEDGSHSYHNLSDPNNRIYYVQTGHAFDALSGMLFYSHGNYKLLPRNDDDFVGYTTDVSDVVELPTKYSISQNYPNPFNPSTSIEYSLPEAGNVTLNIYNLLGQRVKTILDNVQQSAGTHKVVFDASELPSGIYFYSFKSNNFMQVKKMILMK
jgi:hypothetical protein